VNKESGGLVRTIIVMGFQFVCTLSYEINIREFECGVEFLLEIQMWPCGKARNRVRELQ